MTDLLHLMHHDLRRLARENERLREEVANAATAERARLAGLASEEDRKMVQHYGYLATEAHRANCSGEACCEAPDRRDANKAEAEALALILARLAAARGEAVEEAARLCDRALRTIPAKSQAAAEVYHLAKQIRALFPPPGAEVGRG